MALTKLINLTSGKVCIDDVVIPGGGAIDVMIVSTNMLEAEEKGLIQISQSAASISDQAQFLSGKLATDSVATVPGKEIVYE